MEKQVTAAVKPKRVWRMWLVMLAVLGLLIAGLVGMGEQPGSFLAQPVAELNRAAKSLWATITGGPDSADRTGRTGSSRFGDPTRQLGGASPGGNAGAVQGLAQGALYPATPGQAGPDKPLSISGSVLDDLGRLLPGITVSARRVSGGAAVPTQLSAMTTLTQASDDAGMFKFSPIDPGEYELAVAGSAAYGPAHARVRSGTATAELRLQRLRSVRITGTVSSNRGAPLADVRVRVIGGGASATSNRNGNYAVVAKLDKASQVPVLRFAAQGYRELQKRAEGALAPAAKEVQLDVQLESIGTHAPFSGRVTDTRGIPVSGASAWLSSSAPKSYHRARSNSQGTFAFDDVEIGYAYRLGIDAPGYSSVVSEPFVIGAAGEKRNVVLQSKAYATLSGRVVTSQGQPMPALNAWVRNSQGGSDPPRSIVTDGQGQFTADRVPTGDLTLETHSQPQLQASGIVVKPGQAAQVVVPLDWGNLWLMGRVVDQRGANVPNARATLLWSAQLGGLRSSSRRTASTDNEGYFAFANLGPGEHVLSVQAPGFAAASSRHDPRQATQELRIILSGQAQGHSGSSAH